jgi:septal ring-binding cell division protein DamX/type II secretory pathway predicted ATPase ExeA
LTDTEAFFSTPEAVSRLDLIRHLIENSELVPLVRGPSGSGKSLLASRLQSIAPSNWVVCHFAADAGMQPEHLLAHIARCSGLPLAESDNIRRLHERFELLRRQGSVPVLLVDDAQALPPTSLITLLRLYERQIEGAPLVSLVLFANEDIDKLLATPQLQIMSPQAIQVIDLPLLTREEADGFMRYLFEKEGLDEALLLDANKLTRLYRETEGVPGQLASAILAAVGSSEEKGPSTAPAWLEKKLLIYRFLPVAAVLLLLLLLQGPINELFTSDADKASPKVVEIDLPEEKDSPVTPALTPVERTPTEANVATETDSTLDYPKPASMQPPVTLTQVGESGDVSGVETVSSSDSVESEEDAQSPQLNQPAPADSQEPVAAMEQVTPEQIETVQADVTETAVVEEQEKPQSPAGQVEVEAAVVESGSERPVGQTPESPVTYGRDGLSLTDGQVWVASQPPGNYTLQLLAVGNLQSIQSFIRKHGLSGEVFTIKTRRKGQPWYPLLWGSFSDRDAAQLASKQLPPAIRKAGFWARTFASLQN